MAQGVTSRALCALAVVLTGLVQTQRVAPATLALPLSFGTLVSEPWRLFTAFLGLTVRASELIDAAR